ncbi:CopD family protein [Sphingomonas sp. dw_22]|uniref:CopD family protein n=1 Tax=Sphingomonas sp. dw_22 TaxID=2721175 RepID=UPI001BD38881|nr:CopD family protein [Sphingomonas sp. dw_22]
MMPYLWVKAVHVACVLLFIGGLFSQSFAVAAGQRGDAGAVALASHWDRRVTVPAMLFVWLTGAAIAAEGGWFGSPWLWGKLVLVLALTGLHGVQSGRLRRLRRGDPLQTRMRAVHIAAFIASSAACIAILVVVKPF